MSKNENFYNILIAEDNDVSREMMASVLKTQGYNVFGAIDGGSAIQVINERPIDLAFVDINMSPQGGFEFIRHMVIQGIKIPVVIVTSDTSTDTLLAASELGVRQLLQKPVSPARLIQVVGRTLKREGYNLDAIGLETKQTEFSSEELMQKAIEVAHNNAELGRGRPCGAIIADQNGKILGEGVNGIKSRADPTAHAEVMAIRRAAEKLDRTDLSDLILYCSGEPTQMGKALIESVGIGQVYYALSHADTASSYERPESRVEYAQIGRDEAMKVYEDWLNKQS